MVPCHATKTKINLNRRNSPDHDKTAARVEFQGPGPVPVPPLSAVPVVVSEKTHHVTRRQDWPPPRRRALFLDRPGVLPDLPPEVVFKSLPV